MKMSSAWIQLNTQNITLKIAIIFSSMCSLVFALIATHFAFKEPIIIERACYSAKLEKASTKHTEQEINAFVREAMLQRFDSNVQVKPRGYLSTEEMGFKDKEQRELKEKNITQKILVNEIEIKDRSVKVSADKILSIAKVRSAFSVSLTATLLTVSRDEQNPYGLMLTQINKAEDKKDENQKYD